MEGCIFDCNFRAFDAAAVADHYVKEHSTELVIRGTPEMRKKLAFYGAGKHLRNIEYHPQSQRNNIGTKDRYNSHRLMADQSYKRKYAGIDVNYGSRYTEDDYRHHKHDGYERYREYNNREDYNTRDRDHHESDYEREMRDHRDPDYERYSKRAHHYDYNERPKYTSIIKRG